MVDIVAILGLALLGLTVWALRRRRLIVNTDAAAPVAKEPQG